MKSSVFGLDIGTSTMKAVWLSKEGKGYSVNSVLTAPTPVKGMSSESPLDEEEMARAIKTFVSDAKVHVKKVNVALNESQVYTKIIDMPMLSDKELASAIYWEAEQYIPIALTDVTLDYKILTTPAKQVANAKMQVLLVGAPTRLIDKYQRIMDMANLSLTTIETEIIAAMRSILIEETSPPSLIVNVGTISSSLAIVRNGIIQFVYSIPSGGMAMSRAIASDFNFSLPQAEEYKKVYGITDKNFGGKIGQATQPILLFMITEIKKAIAFFAQKYPDDPIKQVILSGASAKLPGIDIFFANNLGIEAVIANPWKIITSQQLPKDITDSAPSYAVAIGLAMRDHE